MKRRLSQSTLVFKIFDGTPPIITFLCKYSLFKVVVAPTIELSETNTPFKQVTFVPIHTLSPIRMYLEGLMRFL